MKLFKKLFSVAMCLILTLSLFVVAVPVSARTYAVIEFAQLDLPVPDERPDFDIVSLCDDYGVMNFAGNNMIIWTDEETSKDLSETDSFIEGHTYRVRIYIEPTSNQVEIVPDAKFMMDNSGLDWYIYEDSNGIYAQKYFDICGKIENACVYIDEPIANAKPDFTLAHDNRFVAEGNVSPAKNGVSWYDVTSDKYLISGTNNVFEAGHIYKVIFNLRSYKNVFVETTKITVNRYSGIIDVLSESFANVEYTFAELEAPAHVCKPEFISPEPPKCDKEGHIGYYRCECGKIYWDEEAKEPANEDELPIAPTGHFKVTVKGKTATYFETGLTKGVKCENCGKWFTKQTKIAKKTLGKVLGVKMKSSAKKAATVTWKKVKDAGGYVVEYSTSKKFTKKTTKKVTIKKGSTVKTTIKKLTSNKKYYVRIKASKTKGKQTVYGKYSNIVSAKIK